MASGNDFPHLILHRTSRKAPIVPIIDKGEGVYVFDEDGRRYLDFVSGITRPVHIGYGREELAKVAYDQMQKLCYFSPFLFANRPAIDLSETLARLAPQGISHFFFVCDGSEAVESAIKLAKHYHYYRGDKQRYKVISRRGAYHGTTSGALRALGTVLSMRQVMEPITPSAVFVESPYCYRCPLHLSFPACDLACARDVERIVQQESPEHISLFMGEPIQQGFGALAPPEGYWNIIRKICDDYGILLLADEIITGFGRTGTWFAVQQFGLQPDLMTMAKGLSSGYLPLGGVGCTDKVIEPVDTFHHIHTYGNHPVCCAVAVKNLEIMEREQLVENSRQMGEYLLSGLRSLEHHPIVGEARGRGLWAGLDCTLNKRTRSAFPPERLGSLIARALSKGLIIKSMGNALEFAPPLILKKPEVDWAVRVLDECLSEEEKDMGL